MQKPDRRTFDKRLKAISIDIEEKITTMTNLFLYEKMVDSHILLHR
jgi:hypothetical protein